MTLEWQDIVAIVALVGYGLMQLRKVVLNKGTSVTYRVTHAAIHLGATITGAVLAPSPAVGLALGLAGAGAIQFIEQVIAARIGLRSMTGGTDGTCGEVVNTPSREDAEE